MKTMEERGRGYSKIRTQSPRANKDLGHVLDPATGPGPAGLLTLPAAAHSRHAWRPSPTRAGSPAGPHCSAGQRENAGSPAVLNGHLRLQPGLASSFDNGAALTNRQRGRSGCPAPREPAFRFAPEAGGWFAESVERACERKACAYTRAPGRLSERVLAGNGGGRGAVTLGSLCSFPGHSHKVGGLGEGVTVGVRGLLRLEAGNRPYGNGSGGSRAA